MAQNPSNIIPDQLIVVEGGKQLVPAPSSGDSGKVLGVVNASGDVGWVEASGGQLTQVQSDWAENDPSQVSYIDNKPDLSVYATSSAVETALAGKQDTISDLSDIRAGATAGATAVQPSALDSYATTSAMNTALSGKQDNISDLSAIRAGAEAGATAVQPSQLPSSDELVPSATSGDSGKVLTVDNQGNPSWVTPSAGTVYTAGDGVDITNDVISADVDGVTIGIDSTTKKIKSLQTIPTKTSDLTNDSHFVTSGELAPVASTGLYSDLSGTPTIPTVDQTYNASSTNPQSGVAVASAISAIPSEVTTASGYFRLGGSTPVKVRYTGSAEPVVVPDNLDVDNHTKYNGTGTASNQIICVWFDNTNGLQDLGSSYTATLKMKAASLLTGFPSGVTVTGTSQVLYCPSSSWDAPTGPGITNGRLTVTNNDIEEQTVTLSGSNPAVASGYGAYIGFYIYINNARNPDTQQFYDLTDALDALITDIEAGNVFELVWPCESAGTDMLATIPNIPDNANQSDKFLKSVRTGASTWEMRWETVSEVPVSSSYDSGKVLTVYSNGTPRWQTLQLPPTLTAGEGIKIADDEISLDYGSTLAPASTTISGTFTVPPETIDTTSTTYYYSYAYGCGTPVTSDIATLANNGGSATIAFSATGSNMFTLPSTAPNVGIFFLYNKTDTTKCIVIKSSETSVVDMFGMYYYVNITSSTSIDLDFSDVVCYGGATLSDVSVGDWYLGFGAKYTNYTRPTSSVAYWGALFANSSNLTVPANTLTGSYSGSIEVANPLPASTSLDENKVLTVDSSGNAVWGNVALGSVQNIQQVNALPANPDANTLYLIPET